MALQLLSENELKRVASEYQFSAGDNVADKETLVAVEAQSRRALIGAILDCILAALLVISIVINFSTLGKPLRPKEKSASRKYEKKTYGQLAEEK